MSVKEAIIVAGGLGTRLQSVIRDVPKPMAPVNGRPFLEFLIQHLEKNGIEKIVLAISHKADVIIEYFSNTPHKKIKIEYSIESDPLGTGGGVKLALQKTSDSNVLVLNGDTFFNVDIEKLFNKHTSAGADVTLALKHMQNCSRYGTVLLDDNARVIRFGEKNSASAGYINGGVHILKKCIFDKVPDKFSFENDFLAVQVNDCKFYGYPSDGYFIDIGIPEDYERAQRELK